MQISFEVKVLRSCYDCCFVKGILAQVLREHARNSSCPYGLQFRPKPHIRLDRQFQTSMDQICQRAHVELLALMIKEQEKNLAADNQAIQAQQQHLQNLYPDQPKQSSSLQAAKNRARPRMRPKPQHKNTKKVQQTCNFASMQAQLSELQKMFCQMSETMNVKEKRYVF